MGLQILLLVVGLTLLVKGGDMFVAAAVRIAEFMRMPRVVVGSTLVSLATTTPELVVSLMAGSKGEPGLAVGNAVGSCICNIGLILGVTAMLRHVDIHLKTLRMPLVAMVGFALLLLLLAWDHHLVRREGIVLVAGGLVYFIYDFVRHARDIKPADVAEAKAIESAATARFAWFQGREGSVAQFIIGAGIVIVGSRVLVDAAVNLAARLGVPSMIVGLTVIAIGTSLPELITAVTSARKNVSDLAVGNILGANIANLTLIVGSAAIMSKVTMSRPTQIVNFSALFSVFGILFWILWTDRRVSRREGVALLVMYCLYLCVVMFLAAWLKG